MHVLVATDGSVDIDRAATFALALAGEGTTTVGTVVRVPRRMVQELREQYGAQDFAGAEQRLEAIDRDSPVHPAATMLRVRCKQYRKAPPSPDWDGIWWLEAK